MLHDDDDGLYSDGESENEDKRREVSNVDGLLTSAESDYFECLEIR